MMWIIRLGRFRRGAHLRDTISRNRIAGLLWWSRPCVLRWVLALRRRVRLRGGGLLALRIRGWVRMIGLVRGMLSLSLGIRCLPLRVLAAGVLLLGHRQLGWPALVLHRLGRVSALRGYLVVGILRPWLLGIGRRSYSPHWHPGFFVFHGHTV